MNEYSPLQLIQHAFTHVSVSANAAGSRTGKLAMETAISFQQHPQNKRQWQLILRVGLKSNDPQAPFIYETQIGIEGIVEVDENYPTERHEQLAVVNGLSMLYSAIREMAMSVTARSAYGPMSLPTLNFVEVIRNTKAQEKSNQSKHDPKQRKATRTTK